MAEYEDDKFIVINKKHLIKLLNLQDDKYKYGKRVVEYLYGALRHLADFYERNIGPYPDNKYYVCNQDEPYAQEVIDIIIKGENDKNI